MYSRNIYRDVLYFIKMIYRHGGGCLLGNGKRSMGEENKKYWIARR